LRVATPRPLRRCAAHRGFALVELAIAIALSALVAMYAASALVRESEESLAQGSATYILQVADAVQRHLLVHHHELAQGLDVPGTANDLQPTLAELRALGRLPGAFPIQPGSLPTRQDLRIDVLRNAACPGSDCVLTGLVCTTTPVALGSAAVRFDLAQVMVDRMQGAGGSALQLSGGVIRGPALSAPNPLGNVPGIVCGASLVDAALFNAFVRMRDRRDPDLQGNLSVAGSTALGGALTVAGNASVGACAQVLGATGRAAFGCTSPDDIPAGYAGGLRSADVVASGHILASDHPSAFTGANTNYAYLGIRAGAAEIRTSGRAAADRLAPTGSYAAGSACPAGDEGAIARQAGRAGLVVCQSGSWAALQTRAAAHDTCAPDGSVATDATGAQLVCMAGNYQSLADILRTGSPDAACQQPGTTAFDTSSANEMLVCRRNLSGGILRWMRLRDVTQHLSFVSTVEVTDASLGPGGTVMKPACAPAAQQSAVPIIQLVPKAFTTDDGGMSLYATDLGDRWQVFLRSGAAGVLRGAPHPTALAHVYCYFQ
jgi:prepilin-type N-terminal cleavage/methylation domain-containing protein